jgi:2'-5' RNA ligase
MDVTTALTLVIPEKFHDLINIIRKEHDRAYPRWMPHINFIFPFVSEDKFKEIRQKLIPEISSFGAFEIELNEVGYFKQGKNVTMHFKPTDSRQIKALFNTIKTALPDIEIKHDEFNAHVTIGQFKNSEFADKLKEYQLWLKENPIKFTVNQIYILQRSKTDNNLPFEIYDTITI